jgi:2-methylcitrate dehydratase PrpD
VTVSRAIAQFVGNLTWEGLPPDVQDRARACLLNSYGIALSGWMTPYAPVARETAMTLFGERPTGATMLGDGRRTTVAGAVLANGALFHGRAQEDTCGSAHLGTIVVPLLTAMCETGAYPLDRFLSAMVAGYEVGGLLEGEYIAGSREKGLRASPLYGVVAAAAAAAKMMNLGVERIDAALANAASFTGGIAQSLLEGSDEWRYQVGASAMNGLIAADLAAKGSVSAQESFEGAAGFVRAYSAPGRDPQSLVGDLGKVWSLRRVAFKPYPVCAFNQTPVLAALTIRENVDWRTIASARVRMNPGETGYSGLDSQGPFSTVTGTLMSTPFCMATTLIHGEPTMEAIADLSEGAAMELTRRIETAADAEIPPLSCVTELRLVDGTERRHEQMMQPQDYAYDWADLATRLRRIGDLSGVSDRAFDRIEAFAGDVPNSDVKLVVEAFGLPVRKAGGRSEKRADVSVSAASPS